MLRDWSSVIGHKIYLEVVILMDMATVIKLSLPSIHCDVKTERYYVMMRHR